MRRTVGVLLLVALATVPVVRALGAADSAEETRTAVRRFVLAYVEAQNIAATGAAISMWSERPGVSSVGQGERTRGFESVRDGILRRRQGPQTAELALGSIDIELLGDAGALAVAPFKTASPAGSGGAPIEGVLTLVLEKVNGKWKLVHEHASVKAYLLGQ
jgi:ketosteroid isomerase-like protein